MIKEHDMVVLVWGLPERRLKKGQLGVVVMVHDAAGYEVEFVDSNDKTLAIVPLSADFRQPASLEHREIGPERLTKNSAWQARSKQLTVYLNRSRSCARQFFCSSLLATILANLPNTLGE